MQQAAVGKWHDASRWPAYRQDLTQYTCLGCSVPLELLSTRFITLIGGTVASDNDSPTQTYNSSCCAAMEK
jgi:hypothetical protein